jgi:hypothetical protein
MTALRSLRISSSFVWVCLSIGLPTFAQAVLTNQGIIAEVKAGAPETGTINRIVLMDTDFRLQPQDLAELRRAGVPERVIRMMDVAIRVKKPVDLPKPTVPLYPEVQDPGSPRRIERLRKQIAASGSPHVHEMILDRFTDKSFLAYTHKADIVVLGVVAGFSPDYERGEKAHHDVYVDVQEVIRSRPGANASAQTVFFHMTGGTLRFPEGDVTFREPANPPFHVGQTVILFLKEGPGRWFLLNQEQTRVEALYGKTQTGDKQFHGMPVGDFIKVIRGF